MLKNGLTVIVAPHDHAAKVCMQLWYRVGSKHEASGQKGLAHLIEHMIFKGTTNLSESDINIVTHKLSGSCNAFTSHDYTGYEFALPTNHWQHALPIMADCMNNCTFKEDLLSAELKAVIQELKMYNDDYLSLLIERMIAAIFYDHPYQYPVIGYKQDLWNATRENLLSFYQRHYAPNNAHLVIVGPVTPAEVMPAVKEHFELLRQKVVPTYEAYHRSDITQQSVSLFRDVGQSQVIVGWVVPGMISKKDSALDMMSWLLGNGQQSRLPALLVDDLELALSVETVVYDLVEHGLFLIHFQPKRDEDIEIIIDHIKKEVECFAFGQWTEDEITRAYKKMEMAYISDIEDSEKVSYIIGKYYCAHGDTDLMTAYLSNKEALVTQVREIAQHYLRPSIMHSGKLLPMPASEKVYWTAAQERDEAEDKKILDRKERQSQLEHPVYAEQITATPAPLCPPLEYEAFTLENGLKVMYQHNPAFDKIDLVLDLEMRMCHEPNDKPGIYPFLMDMMTEGTLSYPGSTFMAEVEKYGMSLSTLPGHISLSMLSGDFERGLGYLASLLTEPQFLTSNIEKVRRQLLSDIIEFWDTPTQFIGQLARNEVYGAHPYGKSTLGSKEGIERVTRDDLNELFKQAVTPQGATLVMVGNLPRAQIKSIIERSLASWQGQPVKEIDFPLLRPTARREIDYFMNRDQFILGYAGLSLPRIHQDYDAILLFDYLLTGGPAGSMASRLFQIRERTGLFYTAGGSLLTNAHHEPGMTFIRAIVSGDRLSQAERELEELFKQKASSITDDELNEIKEAIAYGLHDHFSTNKARAMALLFIQKFGLGPDFFIKRMQHIQALDATAVAAAVDRVLNNDTLSKIVIGRVGA